MGTIWPGQRENDVTLNLLLPWFPVILGVGVWGRLLGRSRGYSLGIVCALFWITLVTAAGDVRAWNDPWTALALLAGAAAIVAMGGWAGETPLSAVAPSKLTGTNQSAEDARATAEDGDALDRLSALWDQFDDWLEQHREEGDPWGRFDEFIRSALYECCQAMHVRPYRMLSEGDELAPLAQADPLIHAERVSARRGIMGHVVTTGRSYIVNDAGQGQLVRALAMTTPPLAADSHESIQWCFAVRKGTRRLGVVAVGQLGIEPLDNKPFLSSVERAITMCWRTLYETIRCRSAVLNDPISELSSREAFLSSAEQALRESYRQAEPVVIAVFALEGLRELNDSGRWERADELVREVGIALRGKIRTDDRVGRFDGSRFLLLLRRVDSELASMITSQIMAKLSELCGDSARWGISIAVRCGVAGSGTDNVELRDLVTKALMESRRARLEARSIASDIGPSGPLLQPATHS